MNVKDMFNTLEDGLNIKELTLYVVSYMRENTGVKEWDVVFHNENFEVTPNTTLGEWRDGGTMSISPKGDGGSAVKDPELEDA